MAGSRPLWAEAALKYTETPRITKSMHAALADLKLDELIVVHAGTASFPLAERIRASPIEALIGRNE